MPIDVSDIDINQLQASLMPVNLKFTDIKHEQLIALRKLFHSIFTKYEGNNQSKLVSLSKSLSDNLIDLEQKEIEEVIRSIRKKIKKIVSKTDKKYKVSEQQKKEIFLTYMEKRVLAEILNSIANPNDIEIKDDIREKLQISELYFSFTHIVESIKSAKTDSNDYNILHYICKYGRHDLLLAVFNYCEKLDADNLADKANNTVLSSSSNSNNDSDDELSQVNYTQQIIDKLNTANKDGIRPVDLVNDFSFLCVYNSVYPHLTDEQVINNVFYNKIEEQHFLMQKMQMAAFLAKKNICSNKSTIKIKSQGRFFNKEKIKLIDIFRRILRLDENDDKSSKQILSKELDIHVAKFGLDITYLIKCKEIDSVQDLNQEIKNQLKFSHAMLAYQNNSHALAKEIIKCVKNKFLIKYKFKIVVSLIAVTLLIISAIACPPIALLFISMATVLKIFMPISAAVVGVILLGYGSFSYCFHKKYTKIKTVEQQIESKISDNESETSVSDCLCLSYVYNSDYSDNEKSDRDSNCSNVANFDCSSSLDDHDNEVTSDRAIKFNHT